MGLLYHEYVLRYYLTRDLNGLLIYIDVHVRAVEALKAKFASQTSIMYHFRTVLIKRFNALSRRIFRDF